MGITAALHPVGSDGFYSSQIQLHPAWLWLAQPMTTVAPASPPGLPPASSPDPLSTEPTATVSARGAPMLPSDMESVTESPSPPPLRTATTSTDMSWPLATPSASLILVLPDLSSRGLSSTPATARGALSLSTEEWLSTLDTPCLPLTGLLRVSALDTATATATAMGSTATARGPLMPTTELLPLPTL